MKIEWNAFKGENRALQPMLLGAGQGAVSINQNPVRGDMRPWRAPVSVASVPAGSNTIYRMGRDTPSDTQYWLSWPGVVHAVRGFIADDVTERTYYTGDGPPKYTDNIIGLASAPYPTAFRTLGVPAPIGAPILTAGGGASATVETRYYVYTYVTDKGEESANSPVSASLVCKIDDLVTITNIATTPTGSYVINRVRIYRTQNGTNAVGDFYFSREIAANLATTTDDGRRLAEPLMSANWLPPPDNLTNLTGMWNGMMAGISGNAVQFCEAYKPYAWPIAYDIVPADCKPVALKVFGQAMLMLTTGRPRLVTGGSPDSLDDQPIEWIEACISQRSAVSFGHGVVWACPDGLAYYGRSGPKMITLGLMTKEDWTAINPSTIIASMYQGAYLGMYTVDGVVKGFLVDPQNPSGLFFTDIPATAFFFDEYQDQLYLLDGADIKKWNVGANIAARARSKIYHTTKPVNFGCYQVVADQYPVKFSIDSVNMTTDDVAKILAVNPVFTAPTPNSLRYSADVVGNNPQRLPSSFLGEFWQIDVTTNSAIQNVAVSQSMNEIADI